MTGAPPPGEIAAETRLGPVTAPGQSRRARAALPPAVAEKLERLENAAEAARALARVTSARVRDVRDAQQGLARQIEAIRTNPSARTGEWIRSPADGPHARVWKPGAGADLPALERDFVELTSDLTRHMREAEAAQDRATAAGQVADHARRYLGI